MFSPIFRRIFTMADAPGSSGHDDCANGSSRRRARRRLDLLKLAQPLRRYASTLQADMNASSLLVHQALSAALFEQPCLRDDGALEASLREDIDRHFHRGISAGEIETARSAAQ
jgi:hypothetical protein